MSNNVQLEIIGHIKIFDPNTNEIFVDKKNAINYENFSDALANTVASKGKGFLYQMAFGNGAASVDQTGLITYLPPNTQVTNASLYNLTYMKIIDDTLLSNKDPIKNNISVVHTAGKLYTDIIIQCALDYNEPYNQEQFDNGSMIQNDYTFNEMGILANWGFDSNGDVATKLLTHVVFHPVQKSGNRQIQIEYTIRIQAITNMVTL